MSDELGKPMNQQSRQIDDKGKVGREQQGTQGQATAADGISIEIHPIPSVTLTDEQFLTGVKEGKPVLIAGELRFPQSSTERSPVVVLLHGSSGITLRVERWAQELNSIGVATFALDSFSGRGIRDTIADQSQLGRLAMITDAYRALELLSRHRRVDPCRIVLMGFSRGGHATLYASLKRFQRMHSPAAAQFAAYIPVYAACNTRYIQDDEVAERPIRLFHGIADDYVPIAPSRTYVRRLREKGVDVELTEYEGAYHIFDDPSLDTIVNLPNAMTWRHCQLEEDRPGRIVNVKTGAPFGWDDPCVERGATVGYQAHAHTQAVRKVKRFLATTFELPRT